jgi:putative DNA primase/helicase
MSSLHQDQETRTPTFWAAPELAKAGWPVFPVGPDKQPSVAGGFYAATRDVSQTAAWIEDGRANHDIATPTGLITLTVVIDADTTEAYEKMCEKYGEPHVKTKRGGHWYFRHPQDGKVKSWKFAPGLDCKADGGYVVIPPSRNRTWTRGIPDLATLPPLPEDLKRRLREEGAASTGQGRCAGPVGEAIPDGNRNGVLTSLAGTMRRRGMGEAEIFAALEVTNRLRCKPPLPVEEVRRISGSVARYEPASGRPWWVGVVRKNG